MHQSQAIQNVVQSFFEAIDGCDWAAARRLMAAPFLFDYSSFGAGPAALLSPDAILEQWRGFLPGFDTTHHLLGPLIIDADQREATVRAPVQGVHVCNQCEEEPVWTVLGSYTLSVSKEDEGQGWRLCGIAFHFKAQLGNTRLPTLAQERAQALLSEGSGGGNLAPDQGADPTTLSQARA